MTTHQQAPAFSLETLSEAHNYNRFVVSRMEPFLGSRVLELGTGIGNLTPLFLQNSRMVTAIDIEKSLIDVHRTRVPSSPALKVECISIEQVSAKPEFSGAFDSVVSSNVLEHISDEAIVGVVSAMKKVLKPGGFAVHWVPAFQGLYGSLDASFGHHRRYEKRTAIKLFREAGFDITTCSYWNMIGFFGWWMTGRLLKKTAIPRSSALLFDAIAMPLIARIEPFLWRPFGQSLLIVAQKKDS